MDNNKENKFSTIIEMPNDDIRKLLSDLFNVLYYSKIRIEFFDYLIGEDLLITFQMHIRKLDKTSDYHTLNPDNMIFIEEIQNIFENIYFDKFDLNLNQKYISHICSKMNLNPDIKLLKSHIQDIAKLLDIFEDKFGNSYFRTIYCERNRVKFLKKRKLPPISISDINKNLSDIFNAATERHVEKIDAVSQNKDPFGIDSDLPLTF